MPKTPEAPSATYDRPAKATLVVRTEHGEEWDAAPEDLLKFGYANKLDLYTRTHGMLVEALGSEEALDSSPANDLRYMLELAITTDFSPWARKDGTPWGKEDAEAGERNRVAIRQALSPSLVPVS
jgi:hypothetical protein